jgi:hypothetical protein
MRELSYSLALVTTACLVCAGVVTFRYANYISACRWNDAPSLFLAYCTDPGFADYEHGAYAKDLEPAATAKLREARVVFFGNSRTQMGFSTDATRSFFAKEAIPHYVFGFGYGEFSEFPATIAPARLRSAKVLIINADPFFKHWLSPPAKDALSPWAMWSFGTKRVMSMINPIYCDLVQCSRAKSSIFRDPADGHWIWEQTYHARKPVEIGRPKQPALATASQLKVAKRFLRLFPVRRRCVILTAVPNDQNDWAPYAKDLAARLGVKFVAPAIDGLATFDGNHLDPRSAVRWSAAFLAEARAVIQSCAASSEGAG